MENFLRSKEYWSLVETGYVELEDDASLTDAQQKKFEEEKLKDLKVKNYLFQAIDRTILETILQKDTSKQIWDSMRRKYEGNKRVKRSILQALRKEFEILEMKSGEGVSDYFSRVMTVANKMRIYGEQMRDVTIVEKILRSLNDKFNYIVCSIEESKDIDILSIDELQSSLVVHEQKFHRHNREEQALKVTFEGRGRGRGRQFFNKALVECYKCHKLGHFQSECPSWDKEANYAELGEEEEMLLMSYVELNEAKREDVWFLDSGCSNHICGDKNSFCDLNENFRQIVKLWNNSKMTVMGKGNVRLKVNGLSHVVTEVFFVPDLKNNLLSIGQLQEKGLAILIKHDLCKIYHPTKGLFIQTAMSANRMFILLAVSQPNKPTCFYTATQDLSHLWHCRYGHLSHKGLRTLQFKQMMHGLPQLEASTTICTDCMIGKQHRDPIPKRSAWRASQKLQLIHADICGPISPTSNSKKRYLICFIDDFSRKSWVYFLVEKSVALVNFKYFKKSVEMEMDAYIKCLRTDRGGEFTSQDFNDFCKENGIKRQLTAAYAPQQNGVAERKNRTIMNLVRSMLSEKKIPQTFWPEAVNWTIYILNRSPTLAVKNITPEEAWSGIKPSVEHFRVFGYLAHVHVPDAKRTKLKNKSIACVLLGVSEESKAYRLYNPITKKIITSRDVVFEENKSWNWDKEHVVTVLEWGDNDEEATVS
jgi:transposase InsO family protein